MNVFQTYIVDGHADGVYLDLFDNMPLKCSGNTCTAGRNRRLKAYTSTVTRAQVNAYVAGKKAGLKNSTALVAKESGGMYTAKTWNVQHSHDPYGANTALLAATGKTPQEQIKLVQQVHVKNKYKYLLFVGDYSHPLRAADDFNSSCTTSRIANFLFAVSPGQFLGCNGWDPQFAYPLGEPLGPANTSAAGVTTRHFASGTHVTYDASTNEYQIFWAGQPLPPPSPGPAPSPSR